MHHVIGILQFDKIVQNIENKTKLLSMMLNLNVFFYRCQCFDEAAIISFDICKGCAKHSCVTCLRSVNLSA